MARANIQNTGVYNSKALRQPGDILWKFQPPQGRLDSIPVVADGKVYFGGFRTDQTIYALDAATGRKIWGFYGNYNMHSDTPSVADGIVYISDIEENLYALDGTSGRELWRFTIRDPSLHWSAFTEAVVAGGVVYVGCARNAFYALDGKTGEVIWRFETSSEIIRAPAFAYGTVYFGSRSIDDRGLVKNYMYALDGETGQEKWKVPIQDGGVEAAPVVADGMVFVPTSEEGLYALDASTGQKKWQYSAGSLLLSSPAVAYDIVYVTMDGNLIALDIKTGREKWKFGTSNVNKVSSPVIAEDVVYFMSTNLGLPFVMPFIIEPPYPRGYLYAVDAHTGQELWKRLVKGSLYNSPTLSNGTLYYGDEDGYIYAIR